MRRARSVHRRRSTRPFVRCDTRTGVHYQMKKETPVKAPRVLTLFREKVARTTTRRAAALAVAFTLVAALPVAASTGVFHDVDEDDAHASSVEWMEQVGLTYGCGPDRFCPDRAVSRAQLASFLQRLASSGVVDAGTLDGLSVQELATEGEPGPAGPSGSRGPAGPAGADGAAVLSAAGAPLTGDGHDGDLWWDTAARELYGPKKDGSWGSGVSLTGLQGPAGEPGPQGPIGMDGPVGPEGPTGPAGTEGPTGPQGPAGIEGPAGPQGPEGQIGPEGPEGPEGPTGAQGPQGVQGLAGEDGATGPQGPAGPQGPEGPEGPAGQVATQVVDGPNTAVTAQFGDPGWPITSTASCPAGESVLGGGFRATGADNGSEIYTSSSYPTAGGDGWTVEGWNGHSDTGNLQAFAICTSS